MDRRPLNWGLLSTARINRALIEELTRVSRLKIPILATELLYRRRILGDILRIPH